MSPDPGAGPAPLAGVRVLDLSRVLAGPWAGQLLADYGADVIKVERPGTGDDTRGWGPPWWPAPDAEDRFSAYYLCANRGKRSVAVDLASDAGAGQVRSLAREADVVIENYRVGQLARYGLDHASLSALNPRLITCSITGYGQDGPYAHHAGYDLAIQASGGLMSITGEPDGEPQKVGVAVVDLMTGVYAVTAILAALHERARTGRGRHIDAALLDVQVAMLANLASNYLCTGVAPRRLGNAHASIVPYQVLPTADGHMVLAAGNDAQFRSFCAVAGQPAWADDPRFATNAQRVTHRAALVPLISAATVQRSTAQWCEALDAAGVPCSPILDVQGVFEHPQVRERGLRVDLPDTQGRAVPGVATPMCFDGRRPVARRAPPALDADGSALRTAPGSAWPADSAQR